MRRTILLLVAIALMLAMVGTPALAGSKPYHERMVLSGEFFFPAGTFCDFNYGGTYETVLNYIAWGDPSNPTREFFQGPYTAVHTNLDTGFSLVDTGSYVDVYDYEAQTWVEIGLTWHLRDPVTGKLVEVTAGRATFDWGTGALLTFTPNISDVVGLGCTALGGNLA